MLAILYTFWEKCFPWPLLRKRSLGATNLSLGGTWVWNMCGNSFSRPFSVAQYLSGTMRGLWSTVWKVDYGWRSLACKTFLLLNDSLLHIKTHFFVSNVMKTVWEWMDRASNFSASTMAHRVRQTKSKKFSKVGSPWRDPRLWDFRVRKRRAI